MEPKLREVYHTTGSWVEVVAAQMHFPDSLPSKIREIWENGHQKFVEVHGNEPDPLEFTKTFVDTNFPT